MQRLGKEVAYEAMLDLPVFAQRRCPEHELDFGDEGTVLASLKRRGVNPFVGDPNDKFAKFLGCKDGKFVVGVQNLGMLVFNATEVFDDLDELKIHWQLD